MFKVNCFDFVYWIWYNEHCKQQILESKMKYLIWLIFLVIFQSSAYANPTATAIANNNAIMAGGLDDNDNAISSQIKSMGSIAECSFVKNEFKPVTNKNCNALNLYLNEGIKDAHFKELESRFKELESRYQKMQKFIRNVALVSILLLLFFTIWIIRESNSL